MRHFAKNKSPKCYQLRDTLLNARAVKKQLKYSAESYIGLLELNQRAMMLFLASFIAR
jgi:hypothetical protein